jgi:hypothetical protein
MCIKWLKTTLPIYNEAKEICPMDFPLVVTLPTPVHLPDFSTVVLHSVHQNVTRDKNFVLVNTGQEELEGNTVAGRKAQASSSIIPIIHVTPFRGLITVIRYIHFKTQAYFMMLSASRLHSIEWYYN